MYRLRLCSAIGIASKIDFRRSESFHLPMWFMFKFCLVPFSADGTHDPKTSINIHIYIYIPPSIKVKLGLPNQEITLLLHTIKKEKEKSYYQRIIYSFFAQSTYQAFVPVLSWKFPALSTLIRVRCQL